MRLRYVSDDEAGLRREKRGRQFIYRHARGLIRNERILKRIRSLAIPPAYTSVWICRDANGHIQATGRDARGRKQYRYHPQWRESRDAEKFDRLIAFSAGLPNLRRRISADLRAKGLPRTKVIATVVRLLERSLIRVGNEEYARTNKSYGLTTLRNNHVRVRGERLQFRFRGKSGKFHEINIDDPRLAGIVRRCQDLPGQALFQFQNDAGEYEAVSSEDVNAYLREILGDGFSAKDFRTWEATVLAAEMLSAVLTPDAPPTKKAMNDVIQDVADRLGNTPTICRKSYIHPLVMEKFLDGTLKMPSQIDKRRGSRLTITENAVRKLLKRGKSSSI
jgi:DNA topoisomerase I